MAGLEVDKMFKLLGNPGRYHIVILFTLLMNFWPVLFNHVIMTFYGAHVRHRCKLPHENDVRSENVSYMSEVFTHGEATNTTHSPSESCSVPANYSMETNASVQCPHGWIYDTEFGEQTIVTEWDLVCDRAYLNSLSTTIYFFGVMIGGLIFGPLSDHYGRRPVILTTLIVPTAIGVGIAFVDNYIIFVVLRFIQGCFIQGLQTTNFILITELFAPKIRTFVAPLQGISVDINNMMIALVCYLLPNWRHVQLAYTLPFVLLFYQIWLLPESPRWLLLHNRLEDAKGFFQTVAKFNNIELPVEIDKNEPVNLLQEQQDNNNEFQQNVRTHKKDDSTRRPSFLDLWRTPNMRRRTIILFYTSFAIQISNYGVLLGTSTLPGNKYLVFFLAAVMCAPNSFICVFVHRKFGRRRPLCVSLCGLSISCLLAGVIPEQTVNGVNIKWLVTAFALLARQMAGLSFLSVMVLIAEMFPTSVRNIGAGWCMVCMRIGVMLSAQALLLGTYTFLQLPFIIFGATTSVASFLVLLLPEVGCRKLPDTIQEVEDANDHISMCRPDAKKMGLRVDELVIEDKSGQSGF